MLANLVVKRDELKTKDELLRDFKVLKAEIAVLREAEDKRKQTEERMFFLHEIIQEIVNANNFDEALFITLKKICEKTEWVLGQAWFPDRKGLHLELSTIWYCQHEKLKDFRESSEGLSFLQYFGLPGRAWALKGPVWIQDLSEEPDFPRSAIAKEVGLKAALAIPIMDRNKVLGVLEFFMLDAHRKDVSLIGLVLTASIQLSSLLKLKRIEHEFLLTIREQVEAKSS